jgi:transposase-like protein
LRREAMVAVVVRYSVAFKRQVVGELESGRFRTIEQARVHYGIAGKVTVRRWLEQMGKNDLMPKVVRVEKPDEASQVAELRKQVRQLQQALGQTQLKNVLSESLLEIACEQLGTDVESFKKKADARRSGAPESGAGGR